MNETASSPADLTSQLTRRLAAFTVDFNIRAAPAKVIDNAQKVVLDVLGVSVLAMRFEIGRSLLDFAQANAAPGNCTIWGARQTTSARDAALINGTLAHGLDYDDRNHSSTYTLATALAAGEQVDAPGARLLEGFIVGREVRNSLDPLFAHRSKGVGPGARGWHSNGILGPIASACAAGKVLRLSASETLAAIGLAAGSCAALTRDGGTMAKPFRAGQAATTGLTCALLARSGFSADETALEGSFGLLDALGPLPSNVTASLGEELGVKFQLEADPRIKAYASCTASQSALEAMLRLVRTQRAQVEHVGSIECDLKPYPLVREHPVRGFEGRFSMRCCLALALLNGRVEPEDFTDEAIGDARIQELMRRTCHVPSSPALVVVLKDGSRLVENLMPPRNLSTWSEIEVKFKRCCEDVLGQKRTETLIELVHGFDNIPSVRPITSRLKPN